MKDQLEDLIDAACDLYGNYSIYEVIDLVRSSAIERMMEMYGQEIEMEKVERYFSILDQICEWRDPAPL
ncbi:MAG: hypothetical protein WBN83_04090 [Desulfoprunum sp.]|jgi:hypothetical protein|uniref:hypothetical protein n=1 Tax=Desulfoprunum sp. TaxID=2020866 RepID=UPI00052C1D65|nr:hypothetical protein JT06_14555 [Desulfobulbus sp. Tol-SR]